MERRFDFRLICEQLPIGLFVLDASGHVHYWNEWLVEKSGITQEQANGQTLGELFPGWHNERFQWAVEQATGYHIPHVLSQALNRMLLPLKVSISERHGVKWMQQKVSVMPLPGRDGVDYALVIIQDVTDTVMRAQAANDVMQRFREVSLRDPLTNLFNRRFMWEWLTQQIKESERSGSALACLMLDLDHFKRLNDSLGHQRGDEILLGFATVVQAQLRESDILVRYGGEEFAALLPCCSLRQAIVIAQRIRQQVLGQSIAGLTAGEVTCSIGVALYDPQLLDSDAEELLREADRRLYEAKHGGRNRVCPATEGEAEGNDDDFQ